jgi:hypothetical protein
MRVVLKKVLYAPDVANLLFFVPPQKASALRQGSGVRRDSVAHIQRHTLQSRVAGTSYVSTFVTVCVSFGFLTVCFTVCDRLCFHYDKSTLQYAYAIDCHIHHSHIFGGLRSALGCMNLYYFGSAEASPCF